MEDRPLRAPLDARPGAVEERYEPGQGDVAHLGALQVEDAQPGVGVLEEMADEVPAAEMSIGEGVTAFGDDLPPAGRAGGRLLEVDGHEAAPRRPLLAQDVETRPDVADHFGDRGEVPHERSQAGRLVEIEHVDLLLGAVPLLMETTR
jgi:hypothetical protein